MAILVTGGAGFIGTHTCVELLNAGEEIVVFDNFHNSKMAAVEAVKKLTGCDFKFYEADMLDADAMERIFAENNITEVIHFAGLKAVGESVAKPLEYYHNNITGTLVLLYTMRRHGCNGLRLSEERADPRGFSAFHNQSLRLHKADDRKYPARPLCGGPNMVHCAFALLQSRRRA